MPNEAVVEKIRENFNRDVFWTRIFFKSDDGKESTVLACASYEYLSGLIGSHEFTSKELQDWVKKVVQKWSDRPDIFRKSVHYDVYATSGEGLANGMKFLQEEIKP